MTNNLHSATSKPQVSADLIKQLRDSTGAPMIKCREALLAENGDLEKATDWLRKYSVNLASKKSDREVSEGLCTYAYSKQNDAIALISTRCETDFVARNKEFAELAQYLAQNGANNAESLSELLNMSLDNSKVSDIIVEKIAKIGENIAVKDYQLIRIDGKRNVIGLYVHGNTPEFPNSGRIVTAVLLSKDLENSNDQDALDAAQTEKMKNFAREILAKHIAATQSLCVAIPEVPLDILQREKEIYLEEIRQKHGDKPQPVLDKILEGKMRKFFEENVLLEQPYVFETEKTIRQKTAEFGQELGFPVRIEKFIRMAIVKK